MILEVKFFRVGVPYPISMHGFGNLTDVRTGFRMRLTDSCCRGQMAGWSSLAI